MYRCTFTRVILQTTQVTMVGDDEDEDKRRVLTQGVKVLGWWGWRDHQCL